MRTLRSERGEEQAVAARRTESADAREIDALLGPPAGSVFGRVNVIHLLERANLAVTLAGEGGEVVGHASFLDHPIGGLVDPAHWEPYMQRHFQAGTLTPLNTLFLHLFVAQPGFAPDSVREILRAVFHAVPELHFICLLSPHLHPLDPVLEEVFEPLQTHQDAPPCVALISYRHQYCPRLHVRQGREEDHDELLHIVSEQSTELEEILGGYSLATLLEEQDPQHQTAVCESGGAAVGFMSVSADVELEVLDQSFDLSAFGGLYRPSPDPHPAPLPDNPTEPAADQGGGVEDGGGEDGQQGAPEASSLQPNVFCVQMFVMDKEHETRSLDFLPYVFKLFPDRDLCVIAVPRLAPEGPLLQGFQRVPPRPGCTPHQELYLFHRTGLLRSFLVRRAVGADRAAVCDLVAGVTGHRSLLDDLDMFLQARRDPEGVPLEALVAQVEGQVVGVVILRDEEDVEFLRAHYGVESFVYFSQHAAREHGRLRHLRLLPLFQHLTPHLLRDVLRLAHKTCLYLRTYPPLHPAQQMLRAEGCVHDCMVPLAPRRQVVYPLGELGHNAPSWRIMQQQEAFAVRFLSRKLTLEPKVVLNTRVVVVGASLTALAFLEVLALCPHLRFTSLTLVSPHGFPDNRIHGDAHFLSTSCPPSRCSDSALLAVRSVVAVVTGRMVALQRAEKWVVLSGGGRVPYDHLIIATGLQHQVPCPTGAPLGGPQTDDLQTDDLQTDDLQSPQTEDPQSPQTEDPQSPQTGDLQPGDLQPGDLKTPEPGDPESPQTGDPQIPKTPQNGNPQSPKTPQTEDPQSPQDGDPQTPQSGDPQTPQTRDPQTPQTGDPQPLPGGPPPNLLTLTDQRDCDAARDLVCLELLETGGNAVVYGGGLDLYTCVETLLALGVPGSRVHLVLAPPGPAPAPCCFGDPEVGRAVDGALRGAGVPVHRDCVLARMDTDGGSGRITSLSFSTRGAPLHLPCGVLFNFSGEGVDRDVFRSVHGASLVFDGRLVVDAHNFLTADPAVRAAGPLTKFSRRYRAERWAHACYSSREVGRALAAAMLALLDPTVEPPTGRPDPDHLIPEYSLPRVRAGRLPGGFHYLHVSKPSPLPPVQPPPSALPLFQPPPPPQQGAAVVTGSVDEGNYFRIHLDRHQKVDALTCLSLEPLPLSNYLCLYGRHQLLLNQLLARSQDGPTPDLYRFFREPWSLALFHDRFPDLEQEIQQGLESLPLTDEDPTTVTELIRQLAAGRPDLRGGDPALFLRERFARSHARAALRTSALNYLSFNRSQLPGYMPRGPL
ncbi:cilia- and flagella-associated protein 61 isoform X2 [Gadus morhua]|uniref:Cilia and flagella associated protein 61 n=1 Tax=Gadus morhua TaxID=8049 RepID=A0A8C4Z8F6_GADMO|nr:cilia- and flagella-associated protein 61 isoform X2 [Gadus morhua]